MREPYDAMVIVSVVTDNNKATIAKAALIDYEDDDKWVIKTGTALRHPEDSFDYGVAYCLAVGRALQHLGRRLEQKGNGLCKHNDDVRALKIRMREKNEKISTKNKKKV